MPDELLRAVAGLYEEHRQAAFPRRLVVDEVNGVEMVTLDSWVSGCVHTWLQHGGCIDDRRWDILAECEQLLYRVVPALNGDEESYYQRLLNMTVLILECPEDVQPRIAARRTVHAAAAFGRPPAVMLASRPAPRC